MKFIELTCWLTGRKHFFNVNHIVSVSEPHAAERDALAFARNNPDQTDGHVYIGCSVVLSTDVEYYDPDSPGPRWNFFREYYTEVQALIKD